MLLLALTLAWQAEPAAPVTGEAFVEVDYATIDRTLVKEPSYVAAPRYGLFVLDPAGKFACWAVFDRSAPDAEHYDVLYFDRNGNRDLTEEDERFAAVWSEKGDKAGLGIELVVGDVPVPGTALVHTKLRFATVMKDRGPGFWFQMRWNGKEEVSGGYAPASPITTVYATSAAEAPILRPAPLGELTFALYTWGEKEVRLSRGGEDELYVMIGKRGSTPDALSVMSETFLDLGKDELVATLMVPTTSRGTVPVAVPIRKHC